MFHSLFSMMILIKFSLLYHNIVFDLQQHKLKGVQLISSLHFFYHSDKIQYVGIYLNQCDKNF